MCSTASGASETNSPATATAYNCSNVSSLPLRAILMHCSYAKMISFAPSSRFGHGSGGGKKMTVAFRQMLGPAILPADDVGGFAGGQKLAVGISPNLIIKLQ